MRFINYLLLFYWSTGTLFLQQGNFAILDSIPDMYLHCKNTEQPDMTAIEFITEHLLIFGGMFDSHSGNDDQKPHHQPPIRSQANFFFVYKALNISKTVGFNSKQTFQLIQSSHYSFTFHSAIFRPPIPV